jgi:hypothetical protein
MFVWAALGVALVTRVPTQVSSIQQLTWYLPRAMPSWIPNRGLPGYELRLGRTSS